MRYSYIKLLRKIDLGNLTDRKDLEKKFFASIVENQTTAPLVLVSFLGICGTRVNYQL
jgi:hypothetical protein